MEKIENIIENVKIPEEYFELYGKYKAKIDYIPLMNETENKEGKLILVTAITPTPAGEGKTTTTIGLAEYGIAMALAFLVIPVVEIVKLIQRKIAK